LEPTRLTPGAAPTLLVRNIAIRPSANEAGLTWHSYLRWLRAYGAKPENSGKRTPAPGNRGGGRQPW